MFDDAYDPDFASHEQSRQRRDLLLGGGGDADADADGSEADALVAIN